MSRRSTDYALNAVRNFAGAIMWAPEEHLDALTLVLALTHVKGISPNVPSVLATGAAESGKSTLTKNIPLLLASSPFIVDRGVTEQGLRNKFLEATAPDTLIWDDASKIWGQDGRRASTTIQTQLAVNSYEDTGKISVSRNGSTVDAPTYCVSFYNGLGDVLPSDVRTRCIEFPTRAKPPGVRTLNARSKAVMLEAEPLKAELHRWTAQNKRAMETWLIDNGHRIHPLLNSRLLQLWGPLFAIAHAAGGTWPKRCRDAFLALGLDESEKPVPQRDEQALLDTARFIEQTGVDRVFTAELVPWLRELPNEFYRKADTAYLVTDLLPRALGPSREMRGKSAAGTVVRGMGRMAAPLLEKAADLYESLYPEPEQSGPGHVEQELTLERG